MKAIEVITDGKSARLVLGEARPLLPPVAAVAAGPNSLRSLRARPTATATGGRGP